MSVIHHAAAPLVYLYLCWRAGEPTTGPPEFVHGILGALCVIMSYSYKTKISLSSVSVFVFVTCVFSARVGPYSLHFTLYA